MLLPAGITYCAIKCQRFQSHASDLMPSASTQTMVLEATTCVRERILPAAVCIAGTGCWLTGWSCDGEPRAVFTPRALFAASQAEPNKASLSVCRLKVTHCSHTPETAKQNPYKPNIECAICNNNSSSIVGPWSQWDCLYKSNHCADQVL